MVMLVAAGFIIIVSMPPEIEVPHAKVGTWYWVTYQGEAYQCRVEKRKGFRCLVMIDHPHRDIRLLVSDLDLYFPANEREQLQDQ